MYAEKHSVTLTTAADGTATGYLPSSGLLTGRILTLIYTKVDFADGVDFTITAEGTSEGLWTEADVNASTVRAPRQPTHGQDGTASLYAGAGEPVEDRIVLVDDRIKIVIAQGGDTKSGTFTAIIG